MVNIFDLYEIRARFIPAVIVLSLLALPVAGVLSVTEGNFFSSSLIAFGILAFVYGFCFIVRLLGWRIQSRLWESWGGAPSSRVLLDDDRMFTASTRDKLRAAIKSEFDIDLRSSKNTDELLKESQQAFGLALQRIRQYDPNGLWLMHNAEYGFLRNLLGSSKVWLTNAVVSLVLCGLAYFISRNMRIGLFTAISTAFCIVIWVTWKKILPQTTKEAAYQFVESAWLCFLNSVSG